MAQGVFSSIDKYGLDWSKVLGTAIFSWKHSGRLRMSWLAIKGVGHLLIRRQEIPRGVVCRFLFFRSIFRSDYDQFFHAVYSSCTHSKTAVNAHDYFGMNIPAMALLFSEVRSFTKFCRATSSVPAALYFYSKFLECIVCIEQMWRNRFDNLVVFADMQQYDNALVQFFRARGVRTLTLQHGLYIDTSMDVRLANINSINYENCVSELFLAWGDETRQLVERYTAARVKVVGKPIYPSRDANHANGPRQKFFSVVLDSMVYRKYNAALLAIASELTEKTGMKMYVRAHPDDRKNDYELYDEKVIVTASIESGEFVLGHVSTFIYELMSFGLKVFRLRSDACSHVIDERLLFSSADEVVLKLGVAFDFKRQGEYFIKYIGDGSLRQYSKLFDELGAPGTLPGHARGCSMVGQGSVTGVIGGLDGGGDVLRRQT